MMTKKFMLGLALAAFARLAQAQDGSDWRFYAGIGITHGGDTLASGYLQDEQNGLITPFSIRPGTSAELRVGADYRISERFHVQGSIGYADQSPQGINGSFDFRENPIELMGFLNVWEGLRVGAGLRKSWAQFSGTGLGADFPLLGKYTSSHGSVLEMQYLFSTDGNYASQHSLGGVSLRVVNEDLTHDGYSISGHHYEIGGALYY